MNEALVLRAHSAECSTKVNREAQTIFSLVCHIFYIYAAIAFVFSHSVDNVLFTLGVSVGVNITISVKAQHCINGGTNANASNGCEPILSVNICVAIDTMLIFYGDANANFKCEQTFTFR